MSEIQNFFLTIILVLQTHFLIKMGPKFPFLKKFTPWDGLEVHVLSKFGPS